MFIDSNGEQVANELLIADIGILIFRLLCFYKFSYVPFILACWEEIS